MLLPGSSGLLEAAEGGSVRSREACVGPGGERRDGWGTRSLVRGSGSWGSCGSHASGAARPRRVAAACVLTPPCLGLGAAVSAFSTNSVLYFLLKQKLGFVLHPTRFVLALASITHGNRAFGLGC